MINMARLLFIAGVIGPFHDLSPMVTNLKGVSYESTERADRGHMRINRVSCATRKRTRESCWCQTHPDHSVAPGHVERSKATP
jgi:hypothetical protein